MRQIAADDGRVAEGAAKHVGAAESDAAAHLDGVLPHDLCKVPRDATVAGARVVIVIGLIAVIIIVRTVTSGLSLCLGPWYLN